MHACLCVPVMRLQLYVESSVARRIRATDSPKYSPTFSCMNAERRWGSVYLWSSINATWSTIQLACAMLSLTIQLAL